ncbi:toxin-antitoxin system YwqK family antitoxin [Pseudomonas sp. MWU13-2105]|uniref:toxin-antitoxin system YwqK family antitoxin n=1 Tax=Pseudomonas sp. MWU13-2105 TaxID=2935074 RepID=UPI00200BF044|nr:toxin-antitoxin system YwqK family antitoxin [Pseudomonas sp. MWU13-2105]
MSESIKLDLTRGDSHLTGRLLDDQLEGPLKIEESGRPQASLSYSQGELQGLSTLYHPNGKVSAQVPYVAGKTHGIASFFSPEGGLQRKAGYRNGLLHGEATNYFADGSVADVEHNRDGVRDGLYQRFHQNGQIALSSRYLNGQLLDAGQPYAEDGRPLDAEGKPISRWRWWWLRREGPEEA